MDQETLHFIWPVDMDTLWVLGKLYRDICIEISLEDRKKTEKEKERNGAQNYEASQIVSLRKLQMFASAVWHFFSWVSFCEWAIFILYFAGRV